MSAAAQPAALVQEQTHRSQVMASDRTYRVYLPPAYATARTTRYPVIYWFHGYEAENPARDAALTAWVAAHPVIVVESGPADTTGQFPLYFPELIEHIDKTLRTIADRDHRAVTNSAAGGFLAIWEARQIPKKIASASSLGATPDAPLGTQGFDVDTALGALYPTLEGVLIRQVAAGSPLAETLDFHLDAFAHPLPKPAAFSHADPYPNFGVWDWEVVSDRRRPAFTVLENVSRAGFRSTVREWIPAGAALPEIKLSITSLRLYTPAALRPVTYNRRRDGNLRRASQKADARGRLSFDLDGDAYEIGIGEAPGIALASFEIAGAAWAAAGQPILVRLKFWNKGAVRSATTLLAWESPTPGVKFQTPSARLNSLAPGESVTLPATPPPPGPPPSPGRAWGPPMAIPASPSTSPSPPPLPRSPITGSLTDSPCRPTRARWAKATATATPPPGRASPSSCPMPAQCAPPNSSPTTPAWTTPCESAKPARAFRCRPSAPPATPATASRCWPASVSTISPWKSPCGIAIRRPLP